MPELPEVQTVVTTLKPLVCGRKVRSARGFCGGTLCRPARFDLPANLVARTIFDIDRRGKKIVFALDDGNRFYIHLGMTGRLSVEKSGSPLAKHTHLLVDLDEGQMRFVDPRRFGGIFGWVWMGRRMKGWGRSR